MAAPASNRRPLGPSSQALRPRGSRNRDTNMDSRFRGNDGRGGVSASSRWPSWGVGAGPLVIPPLSRRQAPARPGTPRARSAEPTPMWASRDSFARSKAGIQGRTCLEPTPPRAVVTTPLGPPSRPPPLRHSRESGNPGRRTPPSPRLPDVRILCLTLGSGCAIFFPTSPPDRKAGENALPPRPPTHPAPANGSLGVLQSQIAEPKPRNMSAPSLRRAPAWPAASKRGGSARRIRAPKRPCFSPAFALRLARFRPAFSLFFRRNSLKYDETANFFAAEAPVPPPASAGAPGRGGSSAWILRNRKLHCRIHRRESR